MYCLCVNMYYCHRMTTKLQLTNISYIITRYRGNILSSQPPNSVCTGDVSPVLNRPGREPDHKTPSSSEVKRKYVEPYRYSPLVASRSCTLKPYLLFYFFLFPVVSAIQGRWRYCEIPKDSFCIACFLTQCRR